MGDGNVGLHIVKHFACITVYYFIAQPELALIAPGPFSGMPVHSVPSQNSGSGSSVGTGTGTGQSPKSNLRRPAPSVEEISKIPRLDNSFTGQTGTFETALQLASGALSFPINLVPVLQSFPSAVNQNALNSLAMSSLGSLNVGQNAYGSMGQNAYGSMGQNTYGSLPLSLASMGCQPLSLQLPQSLSLPPCPREGSVRVSIPAGAGTASAASAQHLRVPVPQTLPPLTPFAGALRFSLPLCLPLCLASASHFPSI